MLFVVSPLLLLILVLCVWSLLIWLICVLGYFTLDLSCLELSGFLGLGCYFLPRVRRAFSLHGKRPRQPEARAHFPRMRRAFSLRGPSARRRRSGLRKSLDRNRGLFARWEGVASLGLSLPLAPPPASFLQRGWAGSSLEFLSPFFLRTAGSVFGLVNFSLLSHSFKKLPATSLRAFGPVLTLSNAARSSPFHPHLLVASVWGTFLLGVAFWHVICGPYLTFPPS